MSRSSESKRSATFCLPQTTLSSVGIIAASLIHGFMWLILTTWIDGTSEAVAWILDALSLIAVLYYLYVLIMRIRAMSRRSYSTIFIEDLEYAQAWTGLVGYLSAGLIHLIFTWGKTQALINSDPVLIVTLYAIHLFFAILTLILLAISLFDFAANGVDQRRKFRADVDSDDAQVLYGIFPPLTFMVIISLVLLLTLHITALLSIVGAIDGTQQVITAVFNWLSLALGIVYIIALVIQWSQRQKRLLRLARDIELGHCLHGLLFLASCAILHTLFTAGHTPIDYANSAVLMSQLNLIHLYFVIGTLMLIVNALFNMTAKGSEERRISELGVIDEP